MVSYTPPARYPVGLLGLPVPLVGETSEVKLKAWDAVGQRKFTSADLQPVVKFRFCFS